MRLIGHPGHAGYRRARGMVTRRRRNWEERNGRTPGGATDRTPRGRKCINLQRFKMPLYVVVVCRELMKFK